MRQPDRFFVTGAFGHWAVEFAFAPRPGRILFRRELEERGSVDGFVKSPVAMYALGVERGDKGVAMNAAPAFRMEFENVVIAGLASDARIARQQADAANLFQAFFKPRGVLLAQFRLLLQPFKLSEQDDGLEFGHSVVVAQRRFARGFAARRATAVGQANDLISQVDVVSDDNAAFARRHQLRGLE